MTAHTMRRVGCERHGGRPYQRRCDGRKCVSPAAPLRILRILRIARFHAGSSGCERLAKVANLAGGPLNVFRRGFAPQAWLRILRIASSHAGFRRIRSYVLTPFCCAGFARFANRSQARKPSIHAGFRSIRSIRSIRRGRLTPNAFDGLSGRHAAPPKRRSCHLKFAPSRRQSGARWLDLAGSRGECLCRADAGNVAHRNGTTFRQPAIQRECPARHRVGLAAERVKPIRQRVCGQANTIAQVCSPTPALIISLAALWRRSWKVACSRPATARAWRRSAWSVLRLMVSGRSPRRTIDWSRAGIGIARGLPFLLSGKMSRSRC